MPHAQTEPLPHALRSALAALRTLHSGLSLIAALCALQEPNQSAGPQV